MFLTDRKLERRITELKQYRYRDVRHLETFDVKEDNAGVVNPPLPNCFEGWGVLKVGETWKGRDLFLWMHKDVEIPAEAVNNNSFENDFYNDDYWNSRVMGWNRYF